MTISNLATVFGPTLVGYSTEKPTNSELCNQTPLQAMVVESLLDLGEEYWRNVLQKQPATPLLTPK
jgi:Rac GTPase-activating protein 1